MENVQYFSVKTPLCPQRALPKDSSEMVNQLLMGEPLQFLERQEQWVKVESLIDQYQGWVDSKMLDELDEGSDRDAKQMHRSSELISKLDSGGYAPFGHFAKVKMKNVKTLIEDAELFIGAPYLWGGKSIMGIDCSGLTQVVFAVHGIDLPRDASEQCELGDTVPFTETAETGDLAFFDNNDGKIIHVGIVVQEDTTKIIHASGHVRKDTLDHQGIYASDRGEYSHQLRIIKRISNSKNK